MKNSKDVAVNTYCTIGDKNNKENNGVCRRKSVYATTAGSPYIYRNCMVCTVGMGGNDMRRPRPRTEPRRLFLSSKRSSMVVLNDGTGFKAIKS